MKKSSLPTLAALSLVFFGSFASAGLLFPYNRLALKDLDQMNKLVRDKINESKTGGGDATIPLKEALQAVYSRPNPDDMIEKVVGPVKTELDEHNAYESSVKALVKEAIGALKNPKAFGAVPQVTYAVFLENLISEMKPNAGQDFEKSILKTVRDAKIEITKAARDDRALRMMKETASPSEIAGEILDNQEKAAKEAAEKAKSAPKTEEGPSDKKNP